MTYKTLNFTTLTQTQHLLLVQFQSPDNEASVVKGVPINRLDEVRRIVRTAANGRNVRVKFRGPRYDAQRGCCRKVDARSFAVYVD